MTLDVEFLPQLGGRCSRIRVAGHDLLRTHDEDPFFFGWYPLVPWSNRVPGGRMHWNGAVIQLPPNYPDGSALHGHAYAAPWDDGRFHHAADDFPWDYTARQHWAVDGAVLTHALSVTNDSDEPMPAGLGIHPWFAADGGLTVEVPSRAAFHGEGGLAVGPPHPAPPVSGPVPWGADRLFTDLARNEVVLRWQGWGIEAALSFSDAARHVHLAAFERAQAVAVEPVTHAGDGHRRLADNEPGAIDVLGPGQTLAVEYRLAVRA